MRVMMLLVVVRFTLGFHSWLHKGMLRKESLCFIVYYMSVSTFNANKATNKLCKDVQQFIFVGHFLNNTVF